MGCNCKWTEVVLGVIIILFAVVFNVSWGEYIVVIAAALLVIHAFSCGNCGSCASPAPKAKSKKRKK